jgi:hypothetical protein
MFKANQHQQLIRRISETKHNHPKKELEADT